MTRYRQPAKPTSNHITAEGEKRLRVELQYLWKEERPLVTQQVSDAAALGDRSENADYIYGKKRLREIDRRVRYLTKRLESIIVVVTHPSNTNKAYFGAYVTVQDQDSRVHQFRLVGPDEIDPGTGYISIDSPLGKALLGKEATNEVEISSPNGTRTWCVLEILYK